VNHSVVSPPTTSSGVGVGQALSDRNGHAHAHGDDLFEKTVIEYSPPLYRYVSRIRMSLNYDEIWDIVQSTFIEASRKWDTVKMYSQEQRRWWLYCTARRKTYDYFRHLQSRLRLWERCCEEHDTEAAEARLEAEDYEKEKHVHQTLRELSARERD
jgi:DNA-directed RNA polymerase specialized sigma24 family protein